MKNKIIMMTAAGMLACAGVATADSNTSFLSDAPYYRGGDDVSTTHPIRDMERRYDNRYNNRYERSEYKKDGMRARMDRYEDKLDAKEDRFDARHGHGGRLDRWEDKYDRKEDVRDSKY